MSHLRTFACLSFALPVYTTLAATLPPDAGQSIRTIETTPLTIPPPQHLELTLPDRETSAPATGGQSLEVRGFRISGNRTLRESELLPLLNDLKGRSLTLGQLQGAAQRLSEYYRRQGYPLARAYLPEQEIQDGIVEIAVLEGRYDQVRLQNSSRVSSRVLKGPLGNLQSGDPVRAKSLERSLLLLSDLPGADVRATLRPGSSVGTSDLIVEARPAPLVSGSIDADNYGNRYTGEYRLGGTLELNSPLTLGDRLTLRGMVSNEEQTYLRAAYQLPIGPLGTQLGLSYSDMEYDLGKEFNDLDAHGNARIASAFLLQPLVRSRNFSLYSHLQFDYKRLEDDIDLFDSKSDKHLYNWSFGFSGNGQDNLGGGGVTSFAVVYTHGDLNIGSGSVETLDQATARTQGRFNKLNPSLLRLQRLSQRFSLYLRAEGQFSDSNLDSVEKFWLGGPYGVRAYPQGEAPGDEGWLTNLELRYALTPAWQLMAFFDHGEVRLNKDTWDDGDNHRSLSGAGVGVNLDYRGWRLNAVSAWKLGNKDPQSDDDRTPRVWVQIACTF